MWSLLALAGCDDPSATVGDNSDLADSALDAESATIDAVANDAVANAPDAELDPPDSAVADMADNDAAEDMGPACGPVLSFDPSGQHWLDTPWPSDRRLRDGHPDLDDTPLPDNGLLSPYRAVAEQVDGFSLNGAAYARFDRLLDPETLPDPAGTLAADAAIRLEVMTGPQRGRRIPLEVGVPPAADAWVDDRTLMARPVPGFVLPEAAVVCVSYTDALRGADGCPVRVAPGFAEALRSDPSLAPLADAPPAGLVGGTCYTTRRATHRLDAVLADARALPAPAVRVFDVERRGGPARRVVRLEYEAPVYQSGEAPWAELGTGGLRFDGDRPVARQVPVAALLAMPDVDPPLGGFPVVHYATGTGSTMEICIRILRQAYGSGHAIACVDRPGWGERGDGSEPPWPDFRNPFASLGMMAQEVVDHSTLARVIAVVAAGEAEVLTEDPLPPIAAGRTALLGFSQGALMAGIAAGVLTELDAIIIDSGGGLAIEGALLRPDSAALVGVFAPVLGIDAENLNGMHPAVSVLQLLADEVDPINYGPRWFGPELPDVLVLSGIDDTKTLTIFSNALAAAARVPIARPVLIESEAHRLLGIEPVDLPVQGNREGRSSVLIQVVGDHGLRQELGETMDHWLRSRVEGAPEAR